MTPAQSGDLARQIVTTKRGHMAHKAFDDACLMLLREAGHAAFADNFERAVSGWHDEALPYPLPDDEWEAEAARLSHAQICPYTFAQVGEALRLYQRMGSAMVSRQTGVPYGRLERWVTALGLKRTPAEYGKLRNVNSLATRTRW